MTDQYKETEVQAGPSADHAGAVQAGPDGESRRFVWLAVASVILTIMAWIAGSHSAVASVAVSVAAIVAGALALRSHRHGVRNTAITSIIAAAVLLVVIAAFCIVIYVGLSR